MGKKKTYITLTDQFCGCGGSSSGAKQVLDKVGGKVAVALNHWALAIETHNTNFPDTLHDCTDISACDPRRYPSTDILLTSPECTNHSLAKGIKSVKAQMDMFSSGKLDAAAERSRATMWDVPRFAEYHKYNIIIVENVVDARKWVMFDAWLHAMHALGYMHKCVYLNSMFCHPTPQSRDRMYVVFWKKGNKAPKLEFTPQAYCHKCEKDIFAVQTWKKSGVNWGVYGKRGQYVYCCAGCTSIVEPYYYAAFNCIDWSDIGQRIGERKKKLSDNTEKRINYGLDKFGTQVLQVTNKTPGFCNPITNASGTILTVNGHGIINPFVIDDKQTTGIDFRVKSITDRIATVHTDPRMKLVTPFTIQMEHASNIDVGREVTKPLPTQATMQTMGIVTPFVVDGNYNASPSRVSAVNDKMPIITTQHRTGIAFPFLTELIGKSKARGINEPSSTMTTSGTRHYLTTPPAALIVENKGQSKSKPVTSPLGSATTKSHQGLLTSESWNSFIQYNRKQHVTEMGKPINTIATTEQLSVISYEKPKLEDCYYRMLKPQEIKLAMAFGFDYIVLGSGKDQVKQLGNAVTPPAMQWLVQQCVDSLM